VGTTYALIGRQPLVGILVFLFLGVVSVAASWNGEVVVGSDALVISWLGIRRVIPLSAIVGIERATKTVRILLRDGTVRQVITRGKNDDERDRLIERIEHAMTVAAEGTPGAAEVIALGRGERTIEEWITALRALRESSSFRDLAVATDRLFHIVEDPRASAETRAAAACALRDSLDDEGRARLRVAAEACAEPRLRVALEATAEGDEQRIAASLDELSRHKY
jgi:hypothetical protein